MSRGLTIRLFPRRVWCKLHLRHKWRNPDPVIVDGPLDLPARDRDWVVLAFHSQCDRCYKIRSVGYTFTDAEGAVRSAIEDDEGEDWSG